MIRHILNPSLLIAVGLATVANAQWKTESYQLRGGWNAIYLHGDATYDTIDNLFDTGAAANIIEVWRWNPNATAVQFTQSPQIQSPGTPEWSYWKRNEPSAATLARLNGPAAYLVRCSGTSGNTYQVDIVQSPRPPRIQWVREGANLLGFQTPPAGSVTFGSYFSSFLIPIATGSDVFKYVGGDLGPANPLKVFSPLTESLVRNQAYWFESEVVSDFHGPLHITAPSIDGIVFGADGSLVTVKLGNRSNEEITATLTPVTSDTAPAGQATVTGPVPLVLMTMNPGSPGGWDAAPLSGPVALAIPAGGAIQVRLRIDRNHASMAGATKGDLFASILRVTDSTSLMQADLPVSAEKGSFEGLWMGEVELTSVSSVVPYPELAVKTEVPSPMKVRMLMHVDAGGTARLLSQALIGRLASTGEAGICTRESLLDSDAKADAIRLTAASLPLDQVIAGSGSLAAPGTLTHVVNIAYNDPTNPFLHQYHPDHDNLDARFDPVVLPSGKTAYTATMADGAEAPAITRTCAFNFMTYDPVTGLVPVGWGATVLGGTYNETLTGVHKQDLQLGGSFQFRRISDIGTLTTP